MNTSIHPDAAVRPTPLTFAEVGESLWSTKVRIRFGHCDPAGIVYTPKFFDIFNVVIEEWYEDALRIDYYDLIRDQRIGLGYINAHADFFAPCMMGDVLDVAVAVERVVNSSCVLVLHAFKGNREALRGRFTIVTTNLITHKARPIPEKLRNALLDYAK